MSDVTELMRRHITANRDLATADAELIDAVHAIADGRNEPFETTWRDTYMRALGDRTLEYWTDQVRQGRRRVTWVGLGEIPGTIRRVTRNSVLVKLEGYPEPQHLHPADLRPRA